MNKKQELKIGDVILYKSGTSFVAKMIKLVTKSPYHHAAIYIGRGRVAESLEEGFVIRTHGEEWLKNETANHVFRPRNKRLSQKAVKLAVARYLGRPYGFMDLLEILVYKLSGLRIFKKRSKRLICSEAVAQVYKDLGIELVPGKNLDLVSPADISQSRNIKRIYF